MRVKSSFFNDHKITLYGKLEWQSFTEKMKTKYFSKTGKELNHQYRKFVISEIFDVQGSSKSIKTISNYYHLLISDLNLEDYTFYVIGDHCLIGGRAGEIMRYKFQFDFIEKKKINNITLLSQKMIAIR